jgi:hypothetical protein
MRPTHCLSLSMTWGPYETGLEPNPTGTIVKGEIAVNNPILKHFIDLGGYKDMG